MSNTNTTEARRSIRYIVSTVGLFGYWGRGETLDEAMENLKRAARGSRERVTKKSQLRINKFTSDLLFAPVDRLAEDDEADCWVGKDGSLHWIRCERELIRDDPASTCEIDKEAKAGGGDA